MDFRYSLLMLLIVGPFVIAAMVADIRIRKLPNVLNLAIALLGIIVHTLISGWSGLQSSFVGLLLGFSMLVPFYMFRMMGAGDLKFLAALGAYLGSGLIVPASAAGVILGGVVSLVMLLNQKREEAAGRWALMSAKLSSWKMLNSDFASYDSLSQTRQSLPYGVYLGLAALGTHVYQLCI